MPNNSASLSERRQWLAYHGLSVGRLALQSYKSLFRRLQLFAFDLLLICAFQPYLADVSLVRLNDVSILCYVGLSPSYLFMWVM